MTCGHSGPGRDIPAVGQLAGRLAVVTGAGRGIGASIASGLAQAGAEVILAARSGTDLEAIQAEITAAGGRAHVVPADVSAAGDVQRLYAAAARIGTATILVNAAGVFGPMKLIIDSDAAEWMRTVQVNTFGAYLTSRAFVPGMIQVGWGRVLNVTSAAALHTPGPFNSAYATSKAALNQFTRHLAAEVAGTGVTANVFHPGDVKTQMWAHIRDQVARLGAAASANYGSWVEWVDRTGGDPPQKAVDLVLRIASDPGEEPNGEFLWIEDPLQAPIPSLTACNPAVPSYVRDDGR